MRTVADIMVKKIVTVHPDTPIIKAANLLIKNNLNGLPVIDQENHLVGILTEYDFILKKNSIHLLTVIKIFKDLDVFKKDSALVKNQLKDLFNMKVADIMNTDPLSLPATSSLEEVMEVFSQHHKINPIPIVAADKTLVGIVSRHDILKFIGSSAAVATDGDQSIDQKTDQFIKNLDRRFLLVTKGRTRLWLLTSILFALVGFSIAWMLILRVNF